MPTSPAITAAAPIIFSRSFSRDFTLLDVTTGGVTTVLPDAGLLLLEAGLLLDAGLLLEAGFLLLDAGLLLDEELLLPELPEAGLLLEEELLPEFGLLEEEELPVEVDELSEPLAEETESEESGSSGWSGISDVFTSDEVLLVSETEEDVWLSGGRT